MASTDFNVGDVEGQISALNDQIGNINSFDVKSFTISSASSKSLTFTTSCNFILISFGGSNERQGMWLVRAATNSVYYAPVAASTYVSLSNSGGTLTITTSATSITFYAVPIYGKSSYINVS